MKKLIKSEVCGAHEQYISHCLWLKSQQYAATIHMNSSRCSLNEYAAAGEKKKKVKKRKRKRKKLDPNPANILNLK